MRHAALLLAALFAAPAHAAEAIIDRVAAVVDNDVIALSEVYELGSDEIARRCPTGGDACVADAEKEVLDALIDASLQRQELVRLGMDVTPSEVDASIDDIVATYEFGDRDALRLEVESRGFTWDTYRMLQIERPLRERKFVEVVLRSRVSLSDEEIKDAYQRLVRGMERPELVSLEAAGRRPEGGPEGLVDTVGAAAAQVAAIRSGAVPWAEGFAAWDTAGVASAFRGTAFAREDLADALSAAAFGTPVDGVADPVVVNGVVLLVRVVGRALGELDVRSFEEAKDELTEQVFLTKVEQAAEEWLAQARRRAAIRVFVGSGRTARPVRAEPAVIAPKVEETKAGRGPKAPK